MRETESGWCPCVYAIIGVCLCGLGSNMWRTDIAVHVHCNNNIAHNISHHHHHRHHIWMSVWIDALYAFDIFESCLALCCQYIRMSFVPFYAKYAIFIAANRAINNKPLSISFRYGCLIALALSLSRRYYLNDACTCRRFHLLLAPSRIYVQNIIIHNCRWILYRSVHVKLVALIIS